MADQPDGIRDYRDLVVWKEAMEIAELIYVVTRAFPRDEAFGMTAQMRRSASSVPANIAEGFGRAQRKVFVQFLRIAQGSLKELETHVLLGMRVGLVGTDVGEDLMARTERLGKRLVSFVRSLEQRSV